MVCTLSPFPHSAMPILSAVLECFLLLTISPHKFILLYLTRVEAIPFLEEEKKHPHAPWIVPAKKPPVLI